MNRPCISLLTDFGLEDSYVGQVKGIIAGINPAANVVDLTHAIAPQQIEQAATILVDSIDAFSAGTIFVVVVDPGVGSARRGIAAEIGPFRYVCPDNGLLTRVLLRHPLLRAVQLDQQQWWRPRFSSTFHGRDIFAPVAAHWSLGRDLLEFGTPLTSPLVELGMPEFVMDAGLESQSRRVTGKVISIDHFGNVISSIPGSAIPRDAKRVQVQFAGLTLDRVDRCYADRPVGEFIALVGSSGRLEVAIVNGNAASQLGASANEPIYVTWKDPA